ncbi:MAG: hypothetical protein ACE5FJ_11125 [Gemmatimonadales bacterium]
MIMLILRQLISFAALPGTVTILVPIWIASRYSIEITMPATPRAVTTTVAGVLALGVGLALLISTVCRFGAVGPTGQPGGERIVPVRQESDDLRSDCNSGG